MCTCIVQVPVCISYSQIRNTFKYDKHFTLTKYAKLLSICFCASLSKKQTDW